MMNKIFNLTSTFKSHSNDDGSVMIRGMASTSDFDRAGDAISAEAWTKGGLKNFEKNPIILFNHDYDRPIGRATGLKVTENGLELEARISKSAPANVCELVKEGILGAFSVGFRVKDADYLSETDGLKIKDAELFEVSVVSVPCNQEATFSLAKSFDSMDEYEEFKKTFTNRVDLAGQTLAKDEVNTSSVASDTPDGTEKVQKEIQMSEVNTPEIDLEAFAKKVAEETATKIAMKQAEQKAADEAVAQEVAEKAAAEAEAKSQQEAQVKSAVVTAVESGAERLMADVEAKMAAKDADIAEIIAQHQKELEEKSEEMSKMRDSKRVFSDRSDSSDTVSKWGKEFMNAHLLGVMTGKGLEGTAYGRDIIEKAGVTYASAAPNIATEVSGQIEKEIMRELRLASAFREIQINSQAQVLPIQQDAGLATFQQGAATGGNLQTRGLAAPQPAQVTLKAFRLISSTLMDNHVDEEILVNLMPMLVESVARAHARAVDDAILNHDESGSDEFNGLTKIAGNNIFDTSVSASNLTGTSVDAADFLGARKLMGKYGMVPNELIYVVSQKRYYDLIADAGFADITDVGSDVATKLTGQVGSIFGTPVIVSDNFGAEADNACVGLAVNVRNFAIPRLRGVNVEQDYEVMNQRNVIVATQSLGFNQLVQDTATDVSVVRLNAVT
jgi:HK97 family phage prohead protease